MSLSKEEVKNAYSKHIQEIYLEYKDLIGDASVEQWQKEIRGLNKTENAYCLLPQFDPKWNKSKKAPTKLY